jgi:hypothetical protein
MNMSSQSNPVIAGTTLVVANPGVTPDEVKIDLGGTFEFRNELPDSYHFEITFEEPAPPGAGNPLTGTKDDPIFVHMPHEDKTFRYHIVYKTQDGTCIPEPRILLARSCPGCP